MSIDLPTDPPCSLPELLAVYFSYEVQDGEHIPLGGGLHIPRAGFILAHYRDCPNTTPLVAQSWCYLRGLDRSPWFYTVSDGDAAGLVERYQQHDLVLDHDLPHYADAFVIGGLQVDQYGNTNMLGIKGDDGSPFRLRGAGPVAACSMSDHVSRFYIFMTRHEPRVFVEQCDYVSALGSRGRAELGLPGAPRYCFSPLAIMDFEEETGRMRLKSVHPGVTVDQVVDATGFELLIPDVVPETPSPSAEDLELLRTVVDWRGALRHGSVSGPTFVEAGARSS
jgi:glutaconate CoA-transferase subunit B